MDFELVSVGTELLLGQIVNTNARFLSRELSELGFNVFYTTVVGDNPERLKSALRIAAMRADAVITTGGLGPTADDLTKETIAEFCGLRCVMDEKSKRRIEERFQSHGLYMPKSNLKQAEMPEGCIILENNNGTAPGAIVEGKVDGKETTFNMLPGPPSEMKPMFLQGVKPYLEAKADCVIHSKSLRVFGVGESAAEEKLRNIIDRQTNPTIAPYAKTGEVELRLTAKANSVKEAKEMLRPLEQEVRNILNDYIYAVGADASMEETVVSLLKDKGMKLATAESCTGGLIAQKITRIPGASACFDCGAVTYSNAQKTKTLGVREETLCTYGAVSYQTAEEMAEGIRLASGADVGISVTGIAGPDGGTEKKPVGTVYIGIATKEKIWAYHFYLSGNRTVVRERASLYALDLVRRELLGCLEKDTNYIW